MIKGRKVGKFHHVMNFNIVASLDHVCPRYTMDAIKERVELCLQTHPKKYRVIVKRELRLEVHRLKKSLDNRNLCKRCFDHTDIDHCEYVGY